jgi:hypothetical protein
MIHFKVNGKEQAFGVEPGHGSLLLFPSGCGQARAGASVVE